MSAPGESPSQGQDVITLEIEGGVKIDRWVSYAFNDEYLTPASGFHFEVDGKEVPTEQTDALVAGKKVSLTINGHTQCTGSITDVEKTESRNGGTRWIVQGYDAFGPVVEAGADPYTLKFTATQTLEDFAKGVFGPFGFDTMVVSDDKNLQIQTGLKKQRFSKKKGKPLKSYTFPQQLKPHPNEGVYAYAMRILNRAGFHARCGCDGTFVVVAGPDYDQDPSGRLVRHLGDKTENTILDGGVKQSVRGQPSVVLATGYAGGGEWSRAKLKVIRPNEMTAFGSDRFVVDSVRTILDAHPDALELSPVFSFDPSLLRSVPIAKPIFLHDDESRSLEELTNFVTRETRKRQMNVWRGSFLVRGHTFDNAPWAVNTIVEVDDDVTEWHSNMWVIGRTFMNARSTGPLTHLQTIVPFTLQFSKDG